MQGCGQSPVHICVSSGSTQRQEATRRRRSETWREGGWTCASQQGLRGPGGSLRPSLCESSRGQRTLSGHTLSGHQILPSDGDQASWHRSVRTVQPWAPGKPIRGKRCERVRAGSHMWVPSGTATSQSRCLRSLGAVTARPERIPSLIL